MLQNIQPLIRLMNQIGGEHGGKTAAQVALNWTICKGAVPIPGAKTIRQFDQNMGAIGWRLSDQEISELDEMSDRCSA
jgi:aryl-alcohol dehydrogenase-like predicted oxidoreductase